MYEREEEYVYEGWWGISGMCEWMGIQVIEKHRRTVLKVILVGRIGENDNKKK